MPGTSAVGGLAGETEAKSDVATLPSRIGRKAGVLAHLRNRLGGATTRQWTLESGAYVERSGSRSADCHSAGAGDLESVGFDIPGVSLLWGGTGVQAGRAGSDAVRDSHGPARVLGRRAAAPQAEERGGDRRALDDREDEEQPCRAVGLHGVGTERRPEDHAGAEDQHQGAAGRHYLTGLQMIIRVSHAD